jgi:CBS domain-containing protein
MDGKLIGVATERDFVLAVRASSGRDIAGVGA